MSLVICEQEPPATLCTLPPHVISLVLSWTSSMDACNLSTCCRFLRQCWLESPHGRPVLLARMLSFSVNEMKETGKDSSLSVLSQAHRVVKDLLNREIAKPLTMDGRKRLSKWLNEAHYLNDMERCELLELVNKTTILKKRKRCKQEMYGTWWSKVDARFEVGSSKFRFYTEYEPYGFGWGQVRWDIARKGTPRWSTISRTQTPTESDNSSFSYEATKLGLKHTTSQHLATFLKLAVPVKKYATIILNQEQKQQAETSEEEVNSGGDHVHE